MVILYTQRFVVWVDSMMQVKAEGYTGNTMVSVTNNDFGKVLGMCLFDTTVEIDKEGIYVIIYYFLFFHGLFCDIEL